MADEIVIPDTAPQATPQISFGDLIKWGPIIAQVVQTLEAAIAGGATEIPVIKVRVAGKRIELGPCPIRVVP